MLYVFSTFEDQGGRYFSFETSVIKNLATQYDNLQYPESSTSTLWRPQISPHIRDVLCANLCPENAYLIEGFRGFSQPFQENVRIVPQFRPRHFPSTDLSNSLFIDHLNNWRSAIWATNGVKEAISMYKYWNKYVRNLFYAVLFAKYNRLRRHTTIGMLIPVLRFPGFHQDVYYSKYSSLGFSLSELCRNGPFIIGNIGSHWYKLCDVIK